MIDMASVFGVLLLAFTFSPAAAQWPRWEERTLDCTSAAGRTDECVLVAENSKIVRDPSKYKCRTESMPQQDWNKLATKTRLACPIGCATEADLSVIQKRPTDADACQKYYTYGKYRDQGEGEWYLWLAESCRANLTTHCRFNDVPFGESVQGGRRSDDGREPLPSTLSV